MGILKGLLSGDSHGPLEDGEMLSAFAGAEAALDRAIKQLQATAAGTETRGAAGDKPASSGDRRQGDGVGPDGLPDRRSGADRRTGIDRRGPGVEFGRRR